MWISRCVRVEPWRLAADVHGLLLAAGAGTRMGRPKALVHDGDESWLRRGVRALADGGCGRVTVVLGAASDEGRLLLEGIDVDAKVDVVVADDWNAGLSASLRAGLAALADSDADAVAVTLVDLPDVTGAVVSRVLAGHGGPDSLARATYHGRLGHPVVIGRDYWQPIADSVRGDHGARDFLVTHEAELVECGDLATGRDVDFR